jgi:hypothetical protein
MLWTNTSAAGDQGIERALVIGLLEVEHHAALVAVEVEEHHRHALGARRPHLPCGIAARRLDLDHVGAGIAQDLRRQRAEHVDREIDHPHAGERPRPGRVAHQPVLRARTMRSGV